MYARLPAALGELIGVISVDRPRNGRRPGPWGREALQMYAFQAAIAISSPHAPPCTPGVYIGA